MVPGASPVGSTTIWRRNSGLIFRYGTSGTTKPPSVSEAYITSGLVMCLSTLMRGTGRSARIEPVVMSSRPSAGMSMAVCEQPPSPTSVTAPMPASTARRESISISVARRAGSFLFVETVKFPTPSKRRA